MKEFIEKLIGRLEENTIYDKQAIAFMNKYGRGIGFISKKKAIKIINQLAEEYNNNFCEWGHDDKEIDVYFTQCGQAHIFCDGNPEENSHEFCPYCGKKIKVIEKEGE